MRWSVKIPLPLELHYYICYRNMLRYNISRRSTKCINHEHCHPDKKNYQYKITETINAHRLFSSAHALATYNETQPLVDRATLVNLARGCNPGRLVSEWRHWRSFDGQLTLTPHPRVIGRSSSRTISFVSKKFFLHLNGTLTGGPSWCTREELTRDLRANGTM